MKRKIAHKEHQKPDSSSAILAELHPVGLRFGWLQRIRDWSYYKHATTFFLSFCIDRISNSYAPTAGYKNFSVSNAELPAISHAQDRLEALSYLEH